MAAVVVWVAIWWMTEAVPLAATSLLPFVLLPAFGIGTADRIAQAYFNPIIFLFLGGFIIALAMEKWGLHRRIALAILVSVGRTPQTLVFGFMVATAALSMWISNTATAAMMLPIGLAVIGRAEEMFGHDRAHNLSVGIMLGIAYAASIGGMATLVGTPPNMVLAQIYALQFPDAQPITFARWMLFGAPFSVIMLVAVWFLLTRVLCRSDPTTVLDLNALKRERDALGPMSIEERLVGAVFLLTALLWVFREDLSFGFATVPGWSRLLPPFASIHDGTVAIAMASLLFVLPSRSESSHSLLDARVFAQIPWGIILLFGGGFALALGFTLSGLAEWLGEQFSRYANVHPVAAVAGLSVGVNFLTELTSNTAITQMLLPILAAIAGGLGISPLMLMIPAAISASMAFMLPVGTPPNAIVFSSQRVRIAEMVRIGFLINLLGVALTILFTFLVLPLVF